MRARRPASSGVARPGRRTGVPAWCAWPAVAVLALWASCLTAPVAQAADVVAGATVFADNCAGCHGPEGRGGVGPTLEPAGFASLVAVMVAQGGLDMPAFDPGLDEAQIDDVAAFVAQELSAPISRTADVTEGGELYRLYCAGCHSSTGRGEMPAFAGNTLDVRQQTAVARYVEVLVEPPSPGGRGLGYFGPVPEGAVAALGLLVIIALAVWLAWKTRGATA